MKSANGFQGIYIESAKPVAQGAWVIGALWLLITLITLGLEQPPLLACSS